MASSATTRCSLVGAGGRTSSVGPESLRRESAGRRTRLATRSEADHPERANGFACSLDIDGLVSVSSTVGELSELGYIVGGLIRKGQLPVQFDRLVQRHPGPKPTVERNERAVGKEKLEPWILEAFRADVHQHLAVQ